MPPFDKRPSSQPRRQAAATLTVLVDYRPVMEQVETVELDEVFTFVEKKSPPTS